VSFPAEDIERMTPAIRAEIQEHLLRQYFARQRRAQFGKDTTQKRWPRTARWWRNDEQCRLERELGKAESATDCNL
jgi:hypothetical protein